MKTENATGKIVYRQMCLVVVHLALHSFCIASALCIFYAMNMDMNMKL